MIAFGIEQEDPRQPAIRQMIAELNAYLLTLSPPEACYHMTAEEMADPSTTVFVARTPEGRAIGMGSLRREGDGIAEVKRMYTRPEARRQGVSRAVLARLEQRGAGLGYRRLKLETGTAQPEALALYEAQGWERITPYGRYGDDPQSVCFAKDVGPA